MQAPLPGYNAVGYGQYPYMPAYGVNNAAAYFPQHHGGYTGYPAQVRFPTSGQLEAYFL